MSQLTATSKKREVLHIDTYITNQKKELANSVLEKLVNYKQTYIEQINKNATIDEIVKVIKENNKQDLLELKHAKEKLKLQEALPHIDSTEALNILATQSKETIEQLTQLATKANNQLKGTGLAIENFVLNGEFVINSKVEGRIKNMATIYCTNQTQKDLKNLAVKLSDLIQGALKTGLLHHNRLGAIAENIIDINTGEIKYQYIMRY